MNKFAVELLQRSYKSYLQTGDDYFEMPLSNPDELFFYTAAAEGLVEDGYIEPISANIGGDLPNTSYFRLVFRLTQSGIVVADEVSKSKG